MTEDEAIKTVQVWTAQTMERLHSMPRDKVESILTRLFAEVLTGEEYECPGCGYPWPRDET